MKKAPQNRTKRMKSSGDSHVSHTSMGMGDYYGTGVKAKVGKVKEGLGISPMSPKKLGKPPKSLA